MKALVLPLCLLSVSAPVVAEEAAAVVVAPSPGPGAEEANRLWLSRDLSVERGRAALHAFSAWAAREDLAEAHVGEARAAYWLGLQMQDAGMDGDAIQKVFQQGSTAGQRAQKKDPKNPGGYFWDAVNRAKSAEIRGIVSSAGELPALMRLMTTVDKLEPGYFHGGVNRYWGAVITRTPSFLVRMKGQSLEDGADYFRKSLKQSPNFVGTRRFWAELKVKQGDTKGAIALLNEALTLPDPEDADLRMWNAHEKRLARKLLAELAR